MLLLYVNVAWRTNWTEFVIEWTDDEWGLSINASILLTNTNYGIKYRKHIRNVRLFESINLYQASKSIIMPVDVGVLFVNNSQSTFNTKNRN